MIVSIKKSETKGFVDVYKNGSCLGCVMSDGTVTAKEAYESLMNNWSIDNKESVHYHNIDKLN